MGTYTRINNSIFTDTTISNAALAVYCRACYFSSIPNFQLNMNHMQQLSGMGRDAFRRVWHELIDARYIIDRITRNGGRFAHSYSIGIGSGAEVSPLTENQYMVSCQEGTADHAPLTEEPQAVEIAPPTENQLLVASHYNKDYKNKKRERKNSQKRKSADVWADYECAGQMELLTFLEQEPQAEEKHAAIEEQTVTEPQTQADNALFVNVIVPAEVQAGKGYNAEKLTDTIKEELAETYTQEQAAAILGTVTEKYNAVDTIIGSPWRYYTAVLRNVLNTRKMAKHDQVQASREPKKNAFCDFEQRQYDFADVERRLLAACMA